MKGLISKILFKGIAIAEYCTVTLKDGIQEKAYLQTADELIDVSGNQWLLCLEPAVFGIWLSKETAAQLTAVSKNKMFFTAKAANAKTVKKAALAVSELEYFDRVEEAGGTLFLFKVGKTKLFHIHFLKTLLLHSRFYKKPAWPLHKYKALVAAYSFPRKVRLISFKKGDQFNIFPMDLLGAVKGTNHFVFGLRHTNVSLAGMIETKKMVVLELSFEHKEMIYQLGKHHTGGPASPESLPFAVQQTANFGFYIPGWVQSYAELHITKTLNLGSHMLLWAEAVNEVKLQEPGSNLYHIHFLHYLYQYNAGTAYPQV